MRRKLFSGGMAWRLLVALILALCLVLMGSSPAAALSAKDLFNITYEISLSKTEINGNEIFYATVEAEATCTNDLPLPVTEARITARVTATHQATGAKVTLNSSYTVEISPFPNKKGETSSESVDVSLQFPDGSEPGIYNVVGELDKAEVYVLVAWVDVTSYLPSSQTMGSVTYVALDGGGVSGPAPTPTAVEVKTNLFGTEASFPISSSGEILETIEATAEDGTLTLTIPEGTIALDIEGEPLSTLTAAVDPSPPPPPKDTSIIGLAYDFGSDGATFDPPITLTQSYDPNDIPEGVAQEDLVLAWYDEAGDKWVELRTTYDPATNTFTAEVEHFTTFAIIVVPPVVAPPAPAAFSVLSLSVLPAEVESGETVTIAVSVANTGGKSGSYTVVLKIDGVKEAEETVTIAAGRSREVSFSVTKEEADTYAVTVDGLSDSFTVVVVLPEPAIFSVSYLSVSPRLEVEPGETVTITALVANTGGKSGSYTVVLKIDGVEEAEETVTIAAGESLDVSFSVTRENPGSYTVEVDGLSGSFTVVVVVAPPGINWALIGGIIAGVVAMGSLLFFLARRSHTKSS